MKQIVNGSYQHLRDVLDALDGVFYRGCNVRRTPSTSDHTVGQLGTNAATQVWKMKREMGVN
jgi:hypothetical protein